MRRTLELSVISPFTRRMSNEVEARDQSSSTLRLAVPLTSKESRIIMSTSLLSRLAIFFLRLILLLRTYPPYHDPPASSPVLVSAAEEERKADVATSVLAMAPPPTRSDKLVRAAAAAGINTGAIRGKKEVEIPERATHAPVMAPAAIVFHILPFLFT